MDVSVTGPFLWCNTGWVPDSAKFLRALAVLVPIAVLQNTPGDGALLGISG